MSFGAHHGDLKEDRFIPSAAKMLPRDYTCRHRHIAKEALGGATAPNSKIGRTPKTEQIRICL